MAILLSYGAIVIGGCSQAEPVDPETIAHRLMEHAIETCLRRTVQFANPDIVDLTYSALTDGSISTIQFDIGEWPDSQLYRTAPLADASIAAIRNNSYAKPNGPIDYSGINQWENARISRTVLSGSQLRFHAAANFGISRATELPSVATIADAWLVSMQVTIREAVPPFDDDRLESGRQAARTIATAYDTCRSGSKVQG